MRGSTLTTFQQAHVAKALAPLLAVPPHVDHQLRHGYRLEGPTIVLFESRPKFSHSSTWVDLDVAKFRFIKSRRRWLLYCQFRDSKWHAYEPLPEAPDLETLVDEVQRDPTGIFWG